jgi:hypothetical protein
MTSFFEKIPLTNGGESPPFYEAPVGPPLLVVFLQKDLSVLRHHFRVDFPESERGKAPGAFD